MINQCWNERREFHSDFLLFYLRWSRSLTFTRAPAPTKMYRLRPKSRYRFRLRNTAHEIRNLESYSFSADVFKLQMIDILYSILHLFLLSFIHFSRFFTNTFMC